MQLSERGAAAVKVSQGSDLTKGFDSLYQAHYQRLARLAMAVLAEDTATPHGTFWRCPTVI
ncbi:MAG: hypothetical protein ACYCO3_12075 [Mycobacteriales bacterium]